MQGPRASAPRRRAWRIAFWLWFAALPALTAILYVSAAMSSDERDRFYGTSGAIFVGGVLALPWLIGLGVLAWLAFRRRQRT